MRFGFILIALLFVTCIQAQIEQSQSILINDDNSTLSTNSYKLSPGLTKPLSNPSLYSNLKDSVRFNRTQKTFDMSGESGLLKPNHGFSDGHTPKWFAKDKEIKESYKSDQYLGDFKSKGEFVTLMYRDHQSVDGDLVRIFINDDIIRSSVYLYSSFDGFKINLIKGFNKIDILALNQGTSGPNTAEFQVYDDTGNLITANEWNLTTGVKATMIIVKD